MAAAAFLAVGCGMPGATGTSSSGTSILGSVLNDVLQGGTISNVICIGLAADASMALIPELDSLPVRIAFLVSGIVMNAIATSMYIGAGFGPGPRDGLMTGIHARLGWSIRSVRTSIEVSVLLIGCVLGGTFGVGTVLYALTIGPLIQLCLPWFRQKPRIAEIPQPERVV